MPWQRLVHGPGELALHTDGKIVWNAGLQSMLGDPEWVTLWWRAENRWLGVCGYNDMRGFPIKAEPEGPEYWVNGAEVLTEAGVSVAENTSAEPQVWVSPVEEEPMDPANGYCPYSEIYYIEIPE